MQQQTSESELLAHFINVDDLYTSEAEVLGAAIRHLLTAHGHVSNKAIILHLLGRLECTTDVVKQDILRQALELVVWRTPDDLSF